MSKELNTGVKFNFDFSGVSGAMSAANEHSAVSISKLKVILWVVGTIPDFHTGGLGSIPPWGILHFSPTFWKKANFVCLLQPFGEVQG